MCETLCVGKWTSNTILLLLLIYQCWKILLFWLKNGKQWLNKQWPSHYEWKTWEVGPWVKRHTTTFFHPTCNNWISAESLQNICVTTSTIMIFLHGKCITGRTKEKKEGKICVWEVCLNAFQMKNKQTKELGKKGGIFMFKTYLTVVFFSQKIVGKMGIYMFYY